MSRDLAIDLGTANTLVYAKGKGVVLNEPTVVALDSRSREVLAIGTDAWQMIGRTPGYIVAERPLRGGAITDFEVTERMLSVLLRRVGVSRLNRPKVLICVPVGHHRGRAPRRQGGGAPGRGLGQLPDRAAHGGRHRRRPAHPRAGRQHGGRRRRRHGRDGGDLARRRGGGAGAALRRLRLRRVHPGLRAPPTTAWPSASARPRRSSSPSGRPPPTPGSSRPRSAAARSPPAGPRRSSSRPLEVRDALEDNVARSSGGRRAAWARRRPSWPRTSCSKGIHLTGGGALLRGMTQRLADATAVPVHLVDTPLECVVQGAGVCLESFDRLSGSSPTTTDPASESTRRSRVAGVVEQLLGGLAHLPVAVAAARPQRGSTRGRRSRPAPPRPGAGPWACRRARRARRGVPPGPRWRRARPPPPPGSARRRGLAAGDQGRRRRPVAAARPGTRRPRRRPAGRGRERAGHGGGERRARARAPHGRAPPRRRAGARRCAVAERGGDVGGRQRPQAGQRAERGGSHAGVGIGEATPGQGRVAAVAGHDDAPPPELGAAVSGPLRGNIVAHRSEYVRPSTRPPTGSRGDPPPSTDPTSRRGRGRAPVPPPRQAPRPSSGPVVLGVLVLVVAAGLVAARSRSTTTSSPRATPRRSRSTSRCRAADTIPLTGKILLTDVFVSQLNALSYLQYRYFDSDSEVDLGADAPGPARRPRTSSSTRATSRWPRPSRTPPRQR